MTVQSAASAASVNMYVVPTGSTSRSSLTGDGAVAGFRLT